MWLVPAPVAHLAPRSPGVKIRDGPSSLSIGSRQRVAHCRALPPRLFGYRRSLVLASCPNPRLFGYRVLQVHFHPPFYSAHRKTHPFLLTRLDGSPRSVRGWLNTTPALVQASQHSEVPVPSFAGPMGGFVLAGSLGAYPGANRVPRLAPGSVAIGRLGLQVRDLIRPLVGVW